MSYYDFRTFSEYMKKEDSSMTASMEDYLEMIYRLSINNGFTRIHELSEALNVQPPSATKMVQRMGELKLLKYEKYGVITLEDNGKEMGKLLLKRHNIIETFLRLMGISDKTVLAETEKVEHTISYESLECFQDFIDFMNANPGIVEEYNDYRKNEK